LPVRLSSDVLLAMLFANTRIDGIERIALPSTYTT
jgi:hypothetical protein